MILVALSLLAAALLQPTAACIPAERSALLAFKAGIKADPQGLLTGWNATGDCCTWLGTFCDSTGHITRLELSPDPAFDDDTYFLKGTVNSLVPYSLPYRSNYKAIHHLLTRNIFLAGTISPALAQLTRLLRLDLASLKQLSGSLPAALGTLKLLQYLSIRRAKLLTGSIPSSYGGLTSLTWLDLGENK
jgi:hypothetical protein